MEYYANTDVGIIRDLNEDSYLVKSYGEDRLLVIIADGMGGHNAGDKASAMAVEHFSKLLDSEYSKIFDFSERKKLLTLQKIAKAVNEKIYSVSLDNNSFNGMGTTLVACIINKNDYFAVNIGDSRLYKIDSDSITQITKDHSLVAELLSMGMITKEQAVNHPKKNVITRALGTEPTVEADAFSGDIQKDSYLLFCTDGLVNMVNEDAVLNVFNSNDNLKIICDKLIEMANKSGGKDNTTVVIVKN